MKKYQEIGKRLKILRGNRTQQDFANEIKTTLRAYQHYEAGERVPRVHLLSKIAELCETTVDWILYGKIRQQSIQNELRVFTTKIKNTLEEMSKLGAIPKATISDDEIAIIKLLRLLSQRDSIEILHQVIEAIERDPNIPKGDKYYDRYINIVRDIIQGQRFFSQGIDFDGLIWGYEALERRKGGVEERRSYPRISLTVPVEFQIMDQHESRPGAVINGSQMGLLIQSPHDVPVGTRIHIKVSLPEKPEGDSFRASAEIIWKKKHRFDDSEVFQYGVRFLEVLSGGHAKLESLLAERV